DLGALLQVLRISGRADLLGEIFQDRRALRELEVAVDQHRHEAVWVEGRIRLLMMRALHQVDHLLLAIDLVVGDEQAGRPRGQRYRMHVELHGFLPEQSLSAGYLAFADGTASSK